MLRLALKLISVVFLAGCASLSVSRSSVGSAADAETRRFERSGFMYLVMGPADGARLSLEELDLRVISRLIGNDVQRVAIGPLLPILPFPGAWWSSAPRETFFLEIQLRPEEPLSFSPLAVTLVHPDGSEVRPSSFLGPVFPEEHGTKYLWESTVPTLFVPPNRPSCFVLQFQRGAQQSWDFSVEVKGIRTMNEPVDVPRVEFQKRSKWFLHWGGETYFCAG